VGAAAKFQAGLKLDPTNAMAFFYLGEAYRAQGRTGDAASAYQHSLKLNASSPIAARAQSQLALLTTPAPAAEPVTTKTPAPVPAAALVLPSPPPPPSPSAPPPPPPVTLPPRPTLAPIPAVQLPACFTNERERNAFHDATYQPAMTVASANNDAAKAYLDRLLAMHAQFMKDGNFNAANTVTYEAVTYQLIAQAAFKASSDYAAMFDTMMGVPLGSCH
jgi:tetratricopeptide (TPR) repeat protein